MTGRKKGLVFMFVLVLIVVFSGTLIFAAGQAEQDQEIEIDGFDWKRFDGDSIRVLALKFYYGNILEEKLSEFEDLTGIEVVFEAYPEDQFRQKLAVEHASGSRNIDVFFTGTAYEGEKFSRSGWYEPLDGYITDENLTSPDWDSDDFIKSVWDAQVFDGNMIAIPVNAVTWLLTYNSKYYVENGLEPPQTMDDLLVNAATLTGDGVYGYVGRGSRTQSVALYGIFLHAFGGSWLGEDGLSAFNSPEGIDALEFYANLMNNYGNPGAEENSWYEVLSLMQQGKAAQIIDTNTFMGQLIDPEQSKVFDEVSFAPIPAGPTGISISELWSWNLAISGLSTKKNQAWYFIQWATNKDIQSEIQLKGLPTSRQSALSNPEFAESVNSSWLESTLKSFEVARPVIHPRVVEIAQIEDAIGTSIVNVLIGKKDAKTALDEAAVTVNSLILETK